MGTGSWIFSILGTLIVLALIVVAIVWLISARRGIGTSGTTHGESASEILNRRLASGELTAEQYEQLRATLGDPPPSNFSQGPRRLADTRA